MREQLYDVLNQSGKRLYINMAYDFQCKMYYWPESNGFITDDHIKAERLTVIESGYYESYRLSNHAKAAS